jgi:hypothetical protein
MIIQTFKSCTGNTAILYHFDFMAFEDGVHPLYVDGCLTLYDFDYYTINAKTLDEIKGK